MSCTNAAAHSRPSTCNKPRVRQFFSPRASHLDHKEDQSTMLLAECRQRLQLLSRQVVAQLRPSTQDKQHDPSKKHLHGYRKTHSPKSLRDSEPIFWQPRFRHSRVFEPCHPLMFSRSSKRAETRHKRMEEIVGTHRSFQLPHFSMHKARPDTTHPSDRQFCKGSM